MLRSFYAVELQNADALVTFPFDLSMDDWITCENKSILQHFPSSSGGQVGNTAVHAWFLSFFAGFINYLRSAISLPMQACVIRSWHIDVVTILLDFLIRPLLLNVVPPCLDGFISHLSSAISLLRQVGVIRSWCLDVVPLLLDFLIRSLHLDVVTILLNFLISPLLILCFNTFFKFWEHPDLMAFQFKPCHLMNRMHCGMIALEIHNAIGFRETTQDGGKDDRISLRGESISQCAPISVGGQVFNSDLRAFEPFRNGRVPAPAFILTFLIVFWEYPDLTTIQIIP
mmetsp:Transcript_5690/g.9510  ORF Transcript_5690/g.9510 Transcript_5690/m.9510 type:complete len:285 (-) Transcript_5690:538-1392(-)